MVTEDFSFRTLFRKLSWIFCNPFSAGSLRSFPEVFMVEPLCRIVVPALRAGCLRCLRQIPAQPVERLKLNPRIVSKAGKPSQIRFASEPGDLAFGVMTCRSLSIGDSLGKAHLSPQNCARLAVAECTKRVRTTRRQVSLTGKRCLSFFNQACRKHGFHSLIDPSV